MKRSDSDIADLTAKNKITKDMLYPTKKKNKKNRHENEEDYEGSDSDSFSGSTDEEDENESGSDEESAPNFHFAFPQPQALLGFPFLPPPVIPPQPFQFRCRQCPAFNWAQPPAATAPNNPRAPQNFRCRPNQNHILCQCCLQPFPNRAGEANLPPTNCKSLCVILDRKNKVFLIRRCNKRQFFIHNCYHGKDLGYPSGSF